MRGKNKVDNKKREETGMVLTAFKAHVLIFFQDKFYFCSWFANTTYVVNACLQGSILNYGQGLPLGIRYRQGKYTSYILTVNFF